MRNTAYILVAALALPLAGLLGSWWPVVPVAAAPTGEPASASSLLDSLLRTDPQLAPVAKRAREYEVQIIYTQINRDEQNQPHFVQHSFRLDDRQYFNPASLVKLPVAALALEKLHQLRQPGITPNTPLSVGTAFRCQTPVPYRIPADSDQVSTVGNYIRRMLLVSDNGAYNRLYEFLGQRPLNERLWALGYPTARIVRRFAPCDTAANRHTNPFTFYNEQGQAIYQQPAAFNARALGFPLGRISKGQGYQAGGRVINQPYDFTTANYLPLQHINDMLKAILFPQATPPTQRFDLTSSDYALLRRYLHQTPHQAKFSAYAAPRYFDAYKKYLYYGRNPDTTLPTSLRIYNVVGMSHGYLADVAYFADSSRQVEFMLSAVIYVNKDAILNDGTYEYTSVGLPFLAQLGRRIHQYESHRPRIRKPNLAEE